MGPTQAVLTGFTQGSQFFPLAMGSPTPPSLTPLWTPLPNPSLWIPSVPSFAVLRPPTVPSFPSARAKLPWSSTLSRSPTQALATLTMLSSGSLSPRGRAPTESPCKHFLASNAFTSRPANRSPFLYTPPLPTSL
eukprot:161781_1